MLFGPVFHFERITTARRKRYYVARVLYGLFLLFALWQEYRGWQQERMGPWRLPPTIQAMSRFAESAFVAFAWAQGVALVCLVPALLAGTIADEHQRKTLHDLLSSRLSSAEIVLGKLGARLLHVGVILVMGIPVVCLVGLFGGLDPGQVACVYLGTFALALFVSGVSMLVSVVARRPREAIVVAYVLVAGWLLVPVTLDPIAEHLGWPLEWVKPVNDALLMTNPIHNWRMLTNHVYQSRYFAMVGYINPGQSVWLAGRGHELLVQFLGMAALQAGFGLFFLVLAVVGLRPLRGGAWARGRAMTRARAPRAWRGPSRPECGDDPMLWKERYAAGGGLTWLRSRPVVLFLGVLLGCYLFDTAAPAFTEFVDLGGRGGEHARLVLNGALRESSTLLFVLVLLSVASAAAVSFTTEREQDTWTSLAATLLTGPEIVRGKVLGALWCSKRLVLALLILWGVGVLAGAVHPLGAAAEVLGLFVFGWFTATLGVFLSLRAKNSTHALFATVAWMLVLNGGYLVALAPVRGSSVMIGAGVMPFVAWVGLLSYRDVRSLATTGAFTVEGFRTSYDSAVLGMYLISLTVYGLGALVLTRAASESFHRVADRPRRVPAAPRSRPAPEPLATTL